MSYEDRELERVDCDNCSNVADLQSDLDMYEREAEELEEKLKEAKERLQDAYNELDSVIDTVKDIMRGLDV
jgi:uncharacterized protein YoxC